MQVFRGAQQKSIAACAYGVALLSTCACVVGSMIQYKLDLALNHMHNQQDHYLVPPVSGCGFQDSSRALWREEWYW